MAVILKSIQGPVQRGVSFFLILASVMAGASGAAVDSGPLPPSITTAPLSVYQVVYRGFPGDRDAEMTVEATYDSPATKNFKIVSQKGSKLIIERVFKRLLESEKEAAAPEMRARTLLNRHNYDMALVGYEHSDKGGQYVLEVSPKDKSKYVYSGKVWVDATDFAVTKIDAEPAVNPSFWTKKSEVHHEYMKVENFWLPRRNESLSYIRLGGRATLTIDYSNYRVNDLRASR